MSLKAIAGSIPVYRADHSLYAHVSQQGLEGLQSAGLVARVVRSRKGDIKRVSLFGQPGEPGATPHGAYLGTRYSFREQVESGSQYWQHKRHARKDEDGRPIDGRIAFLRVVQDCLAP